MKLADISHYIASWQYLERYVNSGSDHRYRYQNDISHQFHPRSNIPFIDVHFLADISYTTLGALRSIPGFPIHPHILSQYKESGYQIISSSKKAVPTSSTRTVFIEDEHPYFLKLDLPVTISRFDRRLVKSDVVYSRYIDDALSRIKLDSEHQVGFGYFQETGGGFFTDIHCREPAFLEREITPTWITQNVHSSIFMVPVFTLISRDPLDDTDPILIQMIQANRADPVDFTLRLVIEPIFDYWNLLASRGILWEMQGQNTILAINDSFQPVGVVIRDNDAAYINYTLGHPLHQGIDYNKHGLKDDSALSKRASLIFDHRVCKQNLLRLIQCIDTFYGQEVGSILKGKTIDYIDRTLHASIKGSLPDMQWYTYSEVAFENGAVTELKQDPPLRRSSR